MENKSLPLSERILACMELVRALLTPRGLTALRDAQSPLSLLTFSSLCRIFCSIRFFFFSSICSARSRACRAFLRRSSLFLGSVGKRGHQPCLLPKCSFQGGTQDKSVLTKESAGGKEPNSLLHFCLTLSLLLLHFLLPLFLSLLLLPEVLQSLPLLLLKGEELRLYQVLGAVSPLRQPGTHRHCWSYSPRHRDGETTHIWQQGLSNASRGREEKTSLLQLQRSLEKNSTPPAVGDHLPQEPGKWWRGSTVQPSSEARSSQLSPVPAENTCTEILSPHHCCGQRAAGHWREGRV